MRRKTGNKIKYDSGFSTLEMLIAMTVLIMVLSAVIFVSFGNQSLSIDNETNAEALNKAQELLEEEQALSRKDFKLVNPIGAQTDGIYQKTISVSNLDFFTKKVTSSITWLVDHNRPQHIDLTTLVTNFQNSVGGETCYSVLSGDWTDPEIESTINFSSISPTGTYTLADLDAYKEKLYVTANKTTNITDPTLFIFDINNPNNPTLIGEVDNAPNVILGLNAISVAEDTTAKKTYAYAASNTASNYSTCNPIDPLTFVPDPACGQLNIFDATNLTPVKTANVKIASSPAVTGQNTGVSMFYENGYLFLGLSANTGGPEFHIVDVHDPSSINSGPYTPLGSLEIGHDVNSINVKGKYAYIASPNANELQITDISNVMSPNIVGGFDIPGGGNGKSLYKVGDRLYFGNTVPSSGNDLHVLDDVNPSSTLPEIAGINLSSSLNEILVRSNLAFLLSNNDLKIFDIGDPKSVAPFSIGAPLATLNLPSFSTSPIPEPSMDCEGNRIYIASNDSLGQGSVYIIKPGP